MATSATTFFSTTGSLATSTFAITGSIFVESIFSYPGMGQLLKIATSNRDYPLMQGILLLIAFYGLFVTLIFESLLKKFTTRY